MACTGTQPAPEGTATIISSELIRFLERDPAGENARNAHHNWRDKRHAPGADGRQIFKWENPLRRPDTGYLPGKPAVGRTQSSVYP